MSKLEKQTLQLPAGFRFHPSDEELITHYLRNKLTSSPLPATIIAELDLYKYNPWELPSKALFGEEEWYFFTPRDRKYPNGTRPNRAAGVGYWKATGTDKHILGEGGMKSIGVKKALVFYSGHPPKGVKSEWIMSEYRLLDNMMWSNHASKPKGSMRLDDWVLCRVRLKCNNMRNVWEDQNTSPSYKPSGHFGKVIREPCLEEVSPSIEMVRSFLHKDLPMLPSILASQHVLPATIKTTSSIVFLNSTTTGTKNSNEADSNKINNCRQISDSSLDFLINPLKRKIEGNEHHHWCSAAPSKRICSRDFRTEEGSYDSLISSTSWGLGNQVQGDNLNGDEWSSLIQYQELGQLIGFPCN